MGKHLCTFRGQVLVVVTSTWPLSFRRDLTMSDEPLLTYLRLVEQRIGATFVAERLYCHVLRTIQGPHTLTVGLRLYEPTAANLARAARLAPAVEAAVGASPVRVYSEQGVLFVELPSPWPAVVLGPQLRGQGLAVPLGLTPRRAIVGLDFAVTPHLLVVGPTSRGKTTAMRGLAYHLARQNNLGQVGLLLLTLKPADWGAFQALANTWAVISEPTEAHAALTWLHATMQARARRSQHLPALFAFVDDLLNLLAVAEVGDLLGQIASLGRAAGIHLVIGSQRLGERGAGGAVVTANIPTRLVFGTASAADAALYAGRGATGAERLGVHPGDALLVTEGGVQRVAVGYVADSDLAALRQNPAAVRPWLHTGAPAAAPLVNGADNNNGAALAGAPAPVVPTGLLQRPPTPADRAALRVLYAQMGSKNRIYITLGVAKNALRAAWLAEALAEEAT